VSIFDAMKDTNKTTREAAKEKYDAGNFEESKNLFLEAIIGIKHIIHLLEDKEEKLSYQAMLARMLKNVAIINYQLENYLESSLYFVQEFETLIEMPGWRTNHDLFVACYNVAGSCESFGDTIRLVNPDKASFYYEMALDYYKQDLELRSNLCPAPDQGVAVVCKDIGCIYVTLGDSRAELYLLSSLNTREDLYRAIQGTHEEMGEIHKILGEFYENQEDYSKSLEHYNLARGIYTALHPSDEPPHELLSAVLSGISRVEFLIKEAESSEGDDRVEGSADDRVDTGTDGDNKASDSGAETDALILEEDASPSEGSNYNSRNIKQEKTAQDQKADQDNLQLANIFLQSLYAWLEQLPEWIQKIMLNSAPVKSVIESAKQEAAMQNKNLLVIDTAEKTVSDSGEAISDMRDDKASMKPIENMLDASMMLSDPGFNYQVILPVAGMASDQMLNPANALDIGNFGIFG